MRDKRLSRRDALQAALKGSTALALGTVFASPARAAAPPAVAITPQLVEAARKEGKVILYSSMDLPVGEKLGKAFEAQYPGIAVQIERSGGSVSQTSAPLATAFSVDVTMRKVAPSGVSTM